MASCDNEYQECDIRPGTVTPKKLPKQSGNGGVEVVSTLPTIDSAEEGIIYVYLTDISNPKTFSGAFVLNTEANQLMDISGSGGGGGGHTYTFESTQTGWKAYQDGVEIFNYATPTYELQKATSETLGGVVVGDNLTVDESGRISGNYQPATKSSYGLVKVDTVLSESSTNPVTNAAVYAAIGNVESILATING